MSDEAAPPPMPPELATKLWRAVCRVMDEDTRDRLMIAGVDLDEEGPYAVAELRAMDCSGRRRWLLRLWPCRSMPTPPPEMRWMSFRKFFGRVLPDDTVIDAAGQKYATEALEAIRGGRSPDEAIEKYWSGEIADAPRVELLISEARVCRRLS